MESYQTQDELHHLDDGGGMATKSTWNLVQYFCQNKRYLLVTPEITVELQFLLRGLYT